MIKDHFNNSHNIFCWLCIDIVMGKLMMVNLGALRVNNPQLILICQPTVCSRTVNRHSNDGQPTDSCTGETSCAIPWIVPQHSTIHPWATGASLYTVVLAQYAIKLYTKNDCIIKTNNIIINAEKACFNIMPLGLSLKLHCHETWYHRLVFGFS